MLGHGAELGCGEFGHCMDVGVRNALRMCGTRSDVSMDESRMGTVMSVGEWRGLGKAEETRCILQHCSSTPMISH